MTTDAVAAPAAAHVNHQPDVSPWLISMVVMLSTFMEVLESEPLLLTGILVPCEKFSLIRHLSGRRQRSHP